VLFQFCLTWVDQSSLLGCNIQTEGPWARARSRSGGEIPSTWRRRIRKHYRYEKLLQGNFLGKPLSLERIVTLRSIQLTLGPSAGLNRGDMCMIGTLSQCDLCCCNLMVDVLGWYTLGFGLGLYWTLHDLICGFLSDVLYPILSC
jgi:hypothetical protein